MLNATSYNPSPSLLDMLGEDGRTWRNGAATVASLRKQGLMNQTSYTATTAGKRAAERHHELVSGVSVDDPDEQSLN